MLPGFSSKLRQCTLRPMQCISLATSRSSSVCSSRSATTRACRHTWQEWVSCWAKMPRLATYAPSRPRPLEEDGPCPDSTTVTVTTYIYMYEYLYLLIMPLPGHALPGLSELPPTAPWLAVGIRVLELFCRLLAWIAGSSSTHVVRIKPESGCCIPQLKIVSNEFYWGLWYW